MSLESEVHENTQTMKSLLQKMGTGGGSGGSINTGGLQGSVNFLGQMVGRAATDIGEFTGKLVRSTADIPDVANVVKGFAGNFGVLGKMMGDAGGGVVNYAMEKVKDWQKFSDAGLSISGDAMLLGRTVALTRMNAQEFGEMFDKMQPQIMGWGATVNDSVQNFAIASDALAKNDNLKKYLNSLGLTIKQQNEFLATAGANRYDIDVQTAAGQEKLLKAMESLVRVVDANTKMSGVSRDAQLENIKQMQNAANYNATLFAKEKEGDTKFTQYAQEAQKPMADAPQILRDAMNQVIAQNGQMYGKALDTFTYFPETKARLTEIGQLLNSRDENDKKRGAEMSKDLQNLLITEMKNRTNVTQMVRLEGVAPAEVSALYSSLGAEGGLARRAKGQSYVDQQMPGTPGGASKEQLARALLEQLGISYRADKELGTTPGQILPGRTSTEVITNLQSRLRDLSTVGVDYITKLNNELGTGNSILKELNSTLLISSGSYAVREFAAAIGKFDGKAEQFPAYIQGLMDKLIKAPQRHTGTYGETGNKSEKGDILTWSLKNERTLNPKETSEYNDVFEPMKALISGDGMRTILPMFSNLGKVAAQISNNAIETPKPEAVASNVQEAGSKLLEQISTKMDQFIVVANSIAKHTDKTARGLDKDPVYG